MGNEVAVLGVGMQPWGKWGKNFVEYGIKAAQDALADANVEWKDVQMICGGETVRNGYPGYVAGATFAEALGWKRCQCLDLVCGLCNRGAGHERGAGAYPLGDGGCGAGHRRGHHSKGLSRTECGRALDRSRLGALPRDGSHQSDLLRALRATSDGSLRRDGEGLRQGQGEEQSARTLESQRALQESIHRGRQYWNHLLSPIRSSCSRSVRPAMARPRWCSRAWTSPENTRSTVRRSRGFRLSPRGFRVR